MSEVKIINESELSLAEKSKRDFEETFKHYQPKLESGYYNFTINETNEYKNILKVVDIFAKTDAQNHKAKLAIQKFVVSSGEMLPEKSWEALAPFCKFNDVVTSDLEEALSFDDIDNGILAKVKGIISIIGSFAWMNNSPFVHRKKK